MTVERRTHAVASGQNRTSAWIDLEALSNGCRRKVFSFLMSTSKGGVGEVGDRKGQAMSDARADCEVLVKSVIGFAQRMLTTQGGFIPFGSAMRADGTIVPVAGHDGRERPQPSDAIALMKKELVAAAHKGEYKATAIVCNVRVNLPSSGKTSDAISVSLNHRENYSITVIFPYTIDGGRLNPGAAFARKGERDIFSPP